MLHIQKHLLSAVFKAVLTVNFCGQKAKIKKNIYFLVQKWLVHHEKKFFFYVIQIIL